MENTLIKRVNLKKSVCKALLMKHPPDHIHQHTVEDRRENIHWVIRVTDRSYYCRIRRGGRDGMSGGDERGDNNEELRKLDVG